MKSLLLYLLLAALFIAGVGMLSKKAPSPKPSPTPLLKQINIETHELFVEIADTEEERQKGLSGRESLNENHGMLFVFDTEKVYPSFWMKGMLIPIDIIWINDGKIVKIDKNVPPEPGKPDSSLTLYRPDKPVDFVLEVGGGISDKYGFKVGDALSGL